MQKLAKIVLNVKHIKCKFEASGKAQDIRHKAQNVKRSSIVTAHTKHKTRTASTRHKQHITPKHITHPARISNSQQIHTRR